MYIFFWFRHKCLCNTFMHAPHISVCEQGVKQQLSGCDDSIFWQAWHRAAIWKLKEILADEELPLPVNSSRERLCLFYLESEESVLLWFLSVHTSWLINAATRTLFCLFNGYMFVSTTQPCLSAFWIFQFLPAVRVLSSHLSQIRLEVMSGSSQIMWLSPPPPPNLCPQETENKWKLHGETVSLCECTVWGKLQRAWFKVIQWT